MDYLVLLALRNNDRVATTYASVDDLDLDNTTIKSLSLPSYPFLPDEGNRIDKDLSPDETGLIADLIRDSHDYVHRILDKPEKLPVLFGSKKAPYLRVHPHYIADFSDDSSSYNAFNNLKSEINACINDIVLQPGDLLFIDNFKAVHGRKEIPGHFDGTDRWFKRGFITRDLRKSREFRVSSSSRTIY
jgi:hypothetical protein